MADRRSVDTELEDEDDEMVSEEQPGSPEDFVNNDLGLDDDNTPDEEEEEGEDLLNDDMMRDYEPAPHLDRYSEEGLDDGSDVDADDDPEARWAAEEALNRRDGGAAGSSGRRGMPRYSNSADEPGSSSPRPRQRRRVNENGDAAPQQEPSTGLASEDQDRYAGEPVKIEDPSEPVRTWITKPNVRREIMRRFKHFLTGFAEQRTNERIYHNKIDLMCQANRQNLEVSFLHLSTMDGVGILAIWTADEPAGLLPILDEVALDVVLDQYPHYTSIHSEIHVRITDLPIQDSIRDIRHVHLDALIRVAGVVTRRTGVFPQLQQVKYDCVKCGFTLGPFFQQGDKEIKVGSCVACQSKGPFNLNVEQTIYRNYQKLTLQESPGTVPAGRLPRHKEVILLHDLIDCARPGEEIDVTGIYTNSFDMSLNNQNGFPVFATVVEANYINKKEDVFAVYKLTDEDKNEIMELAKDPHIGRRIIKSIAPSIFGHENIKTGLALAMFGGQEKTPNSGKHRLRGDINILLLGDPGVAKSQFLKYVEKTAQRAVFATGKGASAVGLTAAVHKDPITREWTLEGGALVLADRGVCLIDEFDKMNDQDRVSIHEAMEQQSISISKAGIVTSLQARCSVIAAANPVAGRYDSCKTFAQNVELTEPILSRFDLLCVVKDTVDPLRDEELARFVLGSHARSHPLYDSTANEGGQPSAPEKDPDIIPQDLLRKYITFAKQTCKPKLHSIDADKITRLYADLRRESTVGQGIAIAVRHMESIIRLSEAHAAMHLRDFVTENDVDVAIRAMLESFISTQKYAHQKPLRKRLGHYLRDNSNYYPLLLEALRELVKEAVRFEESMGRHNPSSVTIKCDLLESKARDYGISDISDFYTSPTFESGGFVLDRDQRVITRQL
eukprot:jgi/Chlat1/7590/Chrsp63S07075